MLALPAVLSVRMLVVLVIVAQQSLIEVLSKVTGFMTAIIFRTDHTVAIFPQKASPDTPDIPLTETEGLNTPALR